MKQNIAVSHFCFCIHFAVYDFALGGDGGLRQAEILLSLVSGGVKMLAVDIFVTVYVICDQL